MKKLLHDPKKRRQLLIAGVAVAGVVLFLVLKGKSSGATTTEEGTKPSTEPLTLPAEGAGSAGGGGTAAGEGQTIAGALQGLGQQSAAENQATQNELAALTEALSASFTPPASPASTAPPGATHTGTPLAGVATNTRAGSPRSGDLYKTGSEKGKPFHEYLNPNGTPKAVPGGVGKHKNRIFLPTKATPKQTPEPAVKNTTAGSPRKGESFTETTYRGKKAHQYAHAVKGGVGPKKNLIII